MKTWRLMGRMLVRDLRAGTLTVLSLALVVAVTALTGVGFLADRVQHAVEQQASHLLGGDILLTADHPWDDAFRKAVRERGLALAESAIFPSMVTSASGVQLAEIKAVSSDYPLRGTMRTAPHTYAADSAVAPDRKTPATGTVWVDARLAGSLQLDLPATLRIGNLPTTATAIVTLEPDRGINPFSIAPRVLLPLADLPSTGLVQPGSRIVWRLHVAGPAPAIEDFRRWANRQLGRGERLEGLDNARPEVRNIIDRAQRFLRLAALLTVVLAAVAIGLAARRYMQTHLDACAVMRCIGASERQILLVHGGEFVLLGVLATALGGGLGYLLQALLHAVMSGLIASDLPPPGGLPWFQGAAVSAVLMLGFVLPPLLRLKTVPTVRVLRREWGQMAPLSATSYLLGATSLAGLMFWMAGDLKLGAVVLGGLAVAVAVFAGVAWTGLRLLARFSATVSRGGWRFGLANVHRRAGTTLVQAVALAIGLTTLLLLTLARDDLLAAWQARVPADAPNRFVINIQPEQRAALADFFQAHGMVPPEMEPMVRGRLQHVNGRTVGAEDFVDDRARRLIEREFNLSSRDSLPPGNVVIAGRWHSPGSTLEFSVEQGLADTLNLHIGDMLDFNIVGQHVSGRITSLRKLDWDSMRVNFFVIAPEGMLDGQPTSYITSFHLPADQGGLIDALVRQFPNLTVIDLAALLRQLRESLDQVTQAVQVVFGFSLLAGVIVLYAALQAGAAEREHELALLRALGARQGQLWQALVAEFALLGSLTGALAGLVATVLGTVLARTVFQLNYWPSLQLLGAGFLLGAGGVTLAGMLATRSGRTRRVVEGLRQQ